MDYEEVKKNREKLILFGIMKYKNISEPQKCLVLPFPCLAKENSDSLSLHVGDAELPSSFFLQHLISIKLTQNTWKCPSTMSFSLEEIFLNQKKSFLKVTFGAGSSLSMVSLTDILTNNFPRSMSYGVK